MKHILIAEDDHFMGNLCRQKLQEAGFAVLVGADGHDIIEQIVLRPPDLLLLDLNLPGFNGLEILKFVRSRERLRKLPVVVISNSSCFSGVVQEALEAGATHFISKAECSPASLVGEVRKAMLPMARPAVVPKPKPAGPEGAPPPLPPVRPKTGPPRTGVLVADDDHVIQGVLTYFLSEAGFSVRSAFDGRQALEMAVSQAPDLLVLDGMMPGLDGMQVLERWQMHPTLSKIPVIMLTGLADEERRDTALGQGAVAYLVKPFNPEELVRRVHHFI